MNDDERRGAHQMQLLCIRAIGQCALENRDAGLIEFLDAVRDVDYEREMRECKSSQQTTTAP